MTTETLHTTWLSLIDRSGPFLSIQVLEAALPQGLEAVQTKFKQKLRIAYEEWRDAVDNDDPQLIELHKEWIRLVLSDILEYDNSSLILNSSGDVKYTNQELASDYSPTFLVKSPASDKIRFFIDVLPPDFDFDKAIENNKWPASTIEKMTLLCRSLKVRYGLLTNGEKWTIVSAPIGATSGTATWYSRLWRYEPVTLKAFQTLLGVRRCFGPANGTLDTLLDSSLSSYEEVTNTLGEQVRRAVEVLIQSLDSADQDRNRELLEGIPPSELYDASVTVMMRLVFLLCAEERGLLLLGDPIYDQFYAVTTLRSQLAEEAGRLGPEVLERRHDAWSRLLATFRVVFGGIEHESLRLPPLGGSLFDPDKYPFLEGRKIDSSWKDSEAAPLPIDNRTVLLLLTALQILEQKGGALHLSYRSLDVEQIGHVYEGLLDSTVSRMPYITLGILGSKNVGHLLLPLDELLNRYQKSNGDLIEYLEEVTEKKASFLNKAINSKVSEEEYGKLLISCLGDEQLALRIKPFYHILRTDIWGQPLIYLSGSYAVTPGANRKDTGTHYTPKALTEEIVSKSLDPILYHGCSDGLPREKWHLKSSSEILSLRVCDPAMGSAAFLVQTCRYLSDALVMAWTKEMINGEIFKISDSEILPLDLHEQLLVAKRLIVEKCLYGVDINPLAVELAKLSLWLITMSKGKPFEFLDHNLKSGDSLMGIHKAEQLFALSFYPSQKQTSFFQKEVDEILKQGIEQRLKIRNIFIKDINDVDRMTLLNKGAREITAHLKTVCDLMCGLALHEKTIRSFDVTIETHLDAIRKALLGDEDAITFLKEKVTHYLTINLNGKNESKRPFHWLIEFPEVFVGNGGFDAIVGNPPFYAGAWLKPIVGAEYRSYLVDYIAEGVTGLRGTADLCCYFLIRSFSLTNGRGYWGLVLNSTAAEGDSKAVGFDQLLSKGVSIYSAKSKQKWPGKASVEVILTWLTKNDYKGQLYLDENVVGSISSSLTEDDGAVQPLILESNKPLICKGHELQGDGFKISINRAKELVSIDQKNAAVISPLITGDVLNNSSNFSPDTFAINFGDMTLEQASSYSEPFKIVLEKVKPERDLYTGDANRDKHLRTYWWRFRGIRKEIDEFAKKNNQILMSTVHSKYLSFVFVDAKVVATPSINCFLSSSYGFFAVLQSSFHECWTNKYSSSLGETMRYIAGRCFYTFPLCENLESELLVQAGKNYHDLRESICIKLNIGLTDLLNSVHTEQNFEESVVKFREEIIKLDAAVLNTYGFNGITLDHNFYQTRQGVRFTISEDANKQILKNLLELNHKLGALEVSTKTKSKKLKSRQETDLEESE